MDPTIDDQRAEFEDEAITNPVYADPDAFLAGAWEHAGDPERGDDALDPSQWEIEGKENADRAMRALRRLDEERAEIMALAQSEIDRIEAWATDRAAPVISRRAFIEERLTDFHRSLVARLGDEAPKTINLPSGALKRRAGRLSVDVSDAGAFVQWATSNDRFDLVRVKAPEPDLPAVKKALKPTGREWVTDDGEIAPGLVPVFGEATYQALPS